MKIDLDNVFDGITECASHPMPLHMEEDCDPCMAEFEAKKAVVDHLAKDVQTDLQQLSVQGMQLPPDFVSNMRLELIIESMLQDRNRIHFETEIARRMTLAMMDAKIQLTKQKLVVPMGAHDLRGPGLSVVRGNGHRT